MKRVATTLLFMILIMHWVNAQSAKIRSLGKYQDFASFISKTQNPSNLTDQQKPRVQLISPSNQSIEGIINLKRDNEIIGEGEVKGSSFYMLINKSGKVEGLYYSVKEKIAYSYYTDEATGNLMVKETDINEVLCVGYEAAPIKESAQVNRPKRTKPIPIFNSRPEAKAVIYLDYDGGTFTGRWNNGKTIVAESFNYTDDEIKKQWEIVAEDFRPWDVNVTTDEAVYKNAPKDARTQCVNTPTKDWAGGGGVAFIGSFVDGRDDPCWVFNKGEKVGGETSSHEVGHTVDLQHDGTSSDTYYGGHGVWAPIMGYSYYKDVGHWSKGEYPKANRKEDDLNIIGTRNNFSILPDDIGDDMAGAKAMVIEANGDVIGEKNAGMIGYTDDKDVFKITAASGGELDIKIDPFYRYPNLNVQARLLDKDGKEIAISAPDDNVMSGAIKETLEAGTYYLEIDGVGEGDLATGYGDYNSMGGYTIYGKAPMGGNLPVAAFKANKQLTCSGQKVKFTDESTGKPTKWEWTFENGTPASSSDQNPEITYNKSGKHKVELKVTNADGSNTKTEDEFITITESMSLPVEEGFEGSFPPADWTIENPDEDIKWEKSTKTGVDSKSCLILNNADYSKVGEKDGLILPELDLTGSADDPALTFYVAYTRFDEKSEDKLRVYISDDCGETWNKAYDKQQKDLETKEVDFDESQEWVPEKESDWRFEVIDLTDYKKSKSVQVKFENTTGYGNVVWVDNINIDYSLRTKLVQTTIDNFNIAPNPTNNRFGLKFSVKEMNDFNIELRNLLGKVVYKQTLSNFKGSFSKSIDLSNVASGIYMLNIRDRKNVVAKKVMKY